MNFYQANVIKEPINIQTYEVIMIAKNSSNIGL